MKLFSSRHIIICVITFAIIFAMNYFGNTQDDKLERALMNGFAGVVGITAGIFILYKAKENDKPHDDFD